ncbi:MAG: hypothetical protein ACOVO3_00340 [Fluviicola sp.]|jgi:hypothetical protein
MRSIVLRIMGGLMCALVLVSMTASSKGFMKKEHPDLIGEYRWVLTMRDGRKVDHTTIEDEFTIRINARDQLLFFRNGKRMLKYIFTPGEAPLLEGNNYVLFRDGAEHFPLFFRNDTVAVFVYPYEFDDNYFVKIKK